MKQERRIMQVIECNKNIRMCFWDNDENKIVKEPVHFVAILRGADGDAVCPLAMSDFGTFTEAVVMSNFLGLECDDEAFDFSLRITDVKEQLEARKNRKSYSQMAKEMGV
jgi:hypothetical protein